MPLSPLHLAKQAVRAGILAPCLIAITGCQNFASPATSAKVRIIDLSQDAPSIDIYQGSTGQGSSAVAYNLGFGTVTSYVSVAPGAATLTADLAGSKQALSSIEGTLLAGAHYTVLVNTSAGTVQQMMLTDRVPPSLTNAPATSTLRIIHQAAHTGAVDIYLVPAGQRLTASTPLVTNLSPGAITGYLTVPTCTCTVLMLPNGTVPSVGAHAMRAGAQVSYTGNSARTLILIDPASTAELSSGPQAITTVDADPAS